MATLPLLTGGAMLFPFDVGDAAVNGTVGALFSGATTLAVGDPRSPFLGSFTEGNIQLIAIDNNAVLPPDPTNPNLIPTINNCVNDCNIARNQNESSNLQGVRDSTSIEARFLSLENRLTSEFCDLSGPWLGKSRTSR